MAPAWRFPTLALASAAAASALPAPFVAGGPYLGWLLGAVMFGMGATLHPSELARAAGTPSRLVAGVAAQFIAMPLLALALAQLFGLDAASTAGLILVGACPGGTASNVITYLVRGDVALSVAMTSASTVMSVVLTPLLVVVYAGTRIDIPALDMMQDIARIVLLPVGLGCAVHALLPKASRAAERALAWFAMGAVAYIVGVVVALNPEAAAVAPTLALAVVCHNLGGLAVGYGTGAALGAPLAVRRTLAVEVGMQNSGLAAGLAMAYFGPAAALPAAIFSVWHNVSGALLAACWSRGVPAYDAGDTRVAR